MTDVDAGTAHAGDIEDAGTGDAAKRVGEAPTTTELDDPERSFRNTAAGTGSGKSDLQPAADDDDIYPSASIEPHNQGDAPN
jgi:hypothetical protein